MAATRHRKSKTAELDFKTKRAHSRFLKTAPSLAAFLGLQSDTRKSDTECFNELLCDEKKQHSPPKQKKKSNKKKNHTKKKSKTNDPNTKSAKKNASKQKPKGRVHAEMRRLVDENADLFHEKESLRIKLTDLEDEVLILKAIISNNEEYKDANDRLRLMVENYKSELTTLQTEGIMLREMLDECTEHDECTHHNCNSPIPHTCDDAHATDSHEKMETVQKVVKEKNDILNELEELKLIYSDMVKDNESFRREVHICKAEIQILSEKLAKEQNRYLRENERNAERIDKLTEDMKMNKDELLIEYERKEQQFIHYIEELEHQNHDLQRHHHSTRMSEDEGRDYPMTLDDKYAILSDSEDGTPLRTPDGSTSPENAAFIETHAVSGDVDDTLLVKHDTDHTDYAEAGYGPMWMSSYWETMHGKHKELDEEHSQLHEHIQYDKEMLAAEQRKYEKRIQKAEYDANVMFLLLLFHFVCSISFM